MRWILSTDKIISGDRNQLQARRCYIEQVTGTNVTPWDTIQVNGKKFYLCFSNDEINGTFITAHIGDVFMICSLPVVYTGELVVANTCIWQDGADKEILKLMRFFNKKADLWFAEQELFFDGPKIRQSVQINNFGLFGFKMSPSECNLFKNRNKGFINAIQRSFVRVSTAIAGNSGAAL